MSNLEPREQQLPSDLIEKVLITGDLAKLSSSERLSYYNTLCTSLGLNPLTKPFEYITLNGKLTLYARKDCTDQLRRIYGVSIFLEKGELIDGVYVVRASAENSLGRRDQSTGAVTIEHLKGDAKANALMKAETKAKRRVTLSICGLGLLDETEVETIKEATPVKPIEEQTLLDRVKAPIEKPVKPDQAPLTPGDHVVRIGKKYVGMKLSEIDSHELESFVMWVNTKADQKFRESDEAQEFLFYAENYLAESEIDELDQALRQKLENE